MRGATPLVFSSVVLLACVQNAKLPDQGEQQATFLALLNSNSIVREEFYSSQAATVVVASGSACDELTIVEGMLQVNRDAEVPISFGIGAVLNGGSIVITAFHVVDGHYKSCILGRGDNNLFKSAAFVVWCSKKDDLAILALDTTVPFSFKWSEAVEIGEDVWTLGRMSPVGGTVTVIKRKSGSSAALVHSTLKLTRGDSGSPLINASGEIVAVNSRAKFRGIFSPRVFRTISSRPSTSIRAGIFETSCNAP